MSKGIGLLSLLLLSATIQAEVDSNIIETEAASAITLAGRMGEAALFSVQADDDDDLEIFATASSQIDNENDHWLLLDWNSDTTTYDLIESGSLQSSEYNYISSHQISHSEVLIGHSNGLLSTITFTDNADEDNHDITQNQVLLSTLTHEEIDGVNFDGDIQAIVQLEGTDQELYTILCTEELIHVLNGEELNSTLQYGGYCQTGNLDYDELADNPGVYDQELVTANGEYVNFDGTNWTLKTGLAVSQFGDNFVIANIDDDDAEEILSQGDSEQVQSFSPLGSGSWVYISVLQLANGNFNVVDSDQDGKMEVLFDYIYTEEEPHAANVNRVSWDTDLDSHVTDESVESPYLYLTKLNRLATTLTDDVETDFFLFAANAQTANPNSHLFIRFNEADLTIDWSGLYSSHGRSFETISRNTDGDTLEDHKIVQIEQISLGEDLYEYAYKFFSTLDLTFSSIVEPEFTGDEIVSVNSLVSFDIDEDGIDELHAGGAAIYDDNSGFLISSYQDGTVQSTLSTPSLASISALYIGDVNLQDSADIVATGEDVSDDGSGIGVHFRYDDATDDVTWFAPSSGDTEFKALFASNIKGEDELEILGLHSQLASYNPNSIAGESSFYNLGNLDLNNFSPITLENRDYQYALATDTAGMLYLIEPKDFDILASTFACSSELSAMASARINNNVDVAFAVCEQTLLSWVVEYDEDIEDYGYSFYELDSTDLGRPDTSRAQLTSLITDDLKTHLFALFTNKFQRFELNTTIGEDTDTDGYVNYRDSFPNEETQWADDDKDNYGDNLDGTDPDPSLNDIDNDGVQDDSDPDNAPVNDFDPENDIDHGNPSFTQETLELIKSESTETLTTVSLTSPEASDLYDDFKGNGTPTISASVQSTALLENGDGDFEANLEPGAHSIEWQAADLQGNIATLNQDVWIYPTISFEAAQQQLGETQTAQVIVNLSGTSPEYPLTVSIEIGDGSVSDDDVTQDITTDLTVTFSDSEVQQTLELEFINDESEEDSETLQLTLIDNFGSEEGNESWTVDTENNIHTITVEDLNVAPEVSVTTSQDGIEVTEATNIAGDITLNAVINDSNDGDTHSYSWDLSSLNLETQTEQSIVIDPSGVLPNDYQITLTVTDDGLPTLSTEETFTLTITYGDSDDDGFSDDIDEFINEETQWVDADGDGLGDNPDGVNPDPSLNDKDNDGIQDDEDSSNEGDDGSPTFNDTTLELIKSESTGSQTAIAISAPQATDLFDDFYGNGTPTITARVNGQPLIVNAANQVEMNLAEGAFTIVWQARDTSGNTTTLDQDVWVYPSIGFDSSQQQVGESQTAEISINLSGTSPSYPVEVTIEVSGGDISNSDVNEDISQNLTVSFNEGDVQTSIDLELLNDNLKENLETLEITILDTFNSEVGNESWTINEDNNTHSILVADFNEAPEIAYSVIQSEVETSAPTNIAGTITIEASITDENTEDTHSYLWNLSSLGLSSQSENIIQIDPENITPGEYGISLLVTDDGLPNLSTQEVFTLTIAYGDSDNDGVLDNVDAFPFDSKESVDSDGDGIGDVADERSVDDSAGTLYFYLLILMPFLFRRRTTSSQ